MAAGRRHGVLVGDRRRAGRSAYGPVGCILSGQFLLTPYSPLTHPLLTPPKWRFIRKFTICSSFFKILLTLLTWKTPQRMRGYSYTHLPYVEKGEFGVSKVSKILKPVKTTYFYA